MAQKGKVASFVFKLIIEKKAYIDVISSVRHHWETKSNQSFLFYNQNISLVTCCWKHHHKIDKIFDVIPPASKNSIYITLFVRLCKHPLVDINPFIAEKRIEENLFYCNFVSSYGRFVSWPGGTTAFLNISRFKGMLRDYSWNSCLPYTNLIENKSSWHELWN